jgi:hypothetical protein
MQFRRALASVMAVVAALGSAAAAERKVAVFDFELVDSSLEGERGVRADEQARLAALGERLRQKLAESGRFEVVDIAPVNADAHAANLQSCGGCDLRLARKLGAELSVTGVVQKVSNLILNINVYARDTASGQMVAAASADIRGNTDESWTRGLDWLLRNRLLTPESGLR